MDFPSDGELACVEPVVEVLSTTPINGATFIEDNREFGVPSCFILALVLAEVSDVVLVTSPAEYSVFVIVMVGEPFVP